MAPTTRRINPKTRARDILARFGISRPPVPVEDIALRLGIAVRYVPLEDELSGMIFLKDGPVVAVNSLHHPNRRRFTLAHEIGHFELHLKEIGQEVHVDKKFLALARDPRSSGGFDSREIEANSFAAALLVPRPMLLEQLHGVVVDIEDDQLVKDLASRFKVSEQMMSFRIGDLVESQFKI
jgi:Zn-dependent peptidase ImmA (M78 family)